MKTAVLFAVFFLSQAEVLGFQEPDSFMGIKWGTSLEDARKRLQNISSNHFSGVAELGRDKLMYSDSLGGVITKFLLTFEKDKFTEVSLRFDSKEFETVEEIFVKRYGKATQSESEAITNPMGVKFLNKKLYWVGRTVYIYLSKYGNTTTEGWAHIAPVSQLQDAEKQKKRAIDDAVKTL